MKVLFSSGSFDPARWRDGLTAEFPDLDFRVHPELGDPAEIEVSLAWRLPRGTFPKLTGLKLIYCTGAGVDQLLRDPELPPDVPLARIVDRGQAQDMAAYVCHQVLDHHRRMGGFREAQRRREWMHESYLPIAEGRVGVMGLGALGLVCAERLADLGFQVAGWTRGPRTHSRIACHAGAEGFAAFLARTDILVNVLALTPETEGILSAATFARLPKGAIVINVGRGGHLVEEDLLAALDSEQLGGATLDVFRTEPLPADSWLWTHPKVTVTPHIASLAYAGDVIRQIADNLRRLRDGLPLHNLVDRRRGY
jgi:glyoxylate/hydroxypyruvate reductase A